MQSSSDDGCCTPQSRHTAGAVVALCGGAFLLVSLVWFLGWGWGDLKALGCPAPWHVWMLVQFLLLLGVCVFYLVDHYRHYRPEMLGRYEEDPEGSHGVLPFGKLYSALWTLSEFVLAL